MRSLRGSPFTLYLLGAVTLTIRHVRRLSGVGQNGRRSLVFLLSYSRLVVFPYLPLFKFPYELRYKVSEHD
jgi:hypothetical protein